MELKEKIAKAIAEKDVQTLGEMVLNGQLCNEPMQEISNIMQEAEQAIDDLLKLVQFVRASLRILLPFLDADLAKKMKEALAPIVKKGKKQNWQNPIRSTALMLPSLGSLLYNLPKKEIVEAAKKVDTTEIRAVDWQELLDISERRDINLLPFIEFVQNNFIKPN